MSIITDCFVLSRIHTDCIVSKPLYIQSVFQPKRDLFVVSSDVMQLGPGARA